MKRQIRRGVFETNSSSCHSLTMCMASDYDRWEKDHLYLFDGFDYSYPKGNKPINGHFYTRKEAIDFINVNTRFKEEIDLTMKLEEIEDILHDWGWYDYRYYWDEYCGDYETFEERTVTPNGDEVVAFGYYGYN